jgi:hypothetical protein
MKASHASFIALLLTAAMSPALSQGVDPRIHKLCIEAKDYAGCVRAMRGDPTPAESGRVINSQGADIAEGNQCPVGHAYIGGGNCQAVRCEYNSSGFNSLGHEQLIAGIKDTEGKDIWGCKFSFWEGSGVLRLSGAVTRASNNPKCPPGEPRPGFNSSCQTAASNWKTAAMSSEEKLGTDQSCDLKLLPYQCSYNAYLEANPTLKKWANLNPELASNERRRLRSID